MHAPMSNVGCVLARTDVGSFLQAGENADRAAHQKNSTPEEQRARRMAVYQEQQFRRKKPGVALAKAGLADSSERPTPIDLDVGTLCSRGCEGAQEDATERADFPTQGTDALRPTVSPPGQSPRSVPQVSLRGTIVRVLRNSSVDRQPLPTRPDCVVGRSCARGQHLPTRA